MCSDRQLMFAILKGMRLMYDLTSRLRPDKALCLIWKLGTGGLIRFSVDYRLRLVGFIKSSLDHLQSLDFQVRPQVIRDHISIHDLICIVACTSILNPFAIFQFCHFCRKGRHMAAKDYKCACIQVFTIHCMPPRVQCFVKNSVFGDACSNDSSRT